MGSRQSELSIESIIPGAVLENDGTTSIRGLRVNSSISKIDYARLIDSREEDGKNVRGGQESFFNFCYLNGAITCDILKVNTAQLREAIRLYGYHPSRNHALSVKNKVTGETFQFSIVGGGIIDYVSHLEKQS
jgi:hypothetical protein